jgi:hypothetical protein
LAGHWEAHRIALKVKNWTSKKGRNKGAHSVRMMPKLGHRYENTSCPIT